ncbi:MAG TPA: GNAT family N-acetyltransferase [Usitatibacter sp.]|jgi:molybdate transport system substrate-binding protein|nr:GNAT family N-acetyltransferase [Usitatibacter sp.]
MGAHREDLRRAARPVTRLEFLSGGAAHGLVRALAPDAGVEPAGHFGAVGAMRERFLAGEPCDIVILTHAQVAELCAQERAEARLCADLGCVATSVAVRASDDAPDVATADGLRAALLAADGIYFPDPSKATAGIHFAKVLEKLGIAAQVKDRLQVFPNGSTAMARMAAAPGHPLGCTQATEILATPGVKLVAPLPAGLDLATVYTAAVSRAARDPVAAERFFERLADDRAAPLRAKAGFEGARIRPATDRDAAGALRVIEAGMSELGLAYPAQLAQRDIGNLEATFVAPGGTFDVAIAADGHVAGCAGVQVLGNNACRLRAMYVEAASRRRGIGRRLLERMVAFARSRRFTRMEIETSAAMGSAIALYAASGFERAERAPGTPGCELVLARSL